MQVMHRCLSDRSHRIHTRREEGENIHLQMLLLRSVCGNMSKYADELVVVDSGELPGSVKRKKTTAETEDKPTEQS